MRYYKIAFCGMGSIGKRHFRNTVKYLQDNGCGFEIDVIRSGFGGMIGAEFQRYISRQYAYEDVIPQDYDIIFITNPTSMHWECIVRYQNCTRSMFVEKPAVDVVRPDMESLRKNLICYVACPLRYTKILQYIRQNVDCEKAYAVRAICSTYLPGWHPDEDYRKSYSAHKDMGGGVAVDLIHEWDYLIWLFGKPTHVNAVRRKVSELETDSEDIAVYTGYTETKVYELHLDYFGKEEVRQVEIYLPEKVMRVDIRNGVIHSSDSMEDMILKEERDHYQLREIAHFFDIIDGISENDNDIMEAVETVKIAREGKNQSQSMLVYDKM